MFVRGLCLLLLQVSLLNAQSSEGWNDAAMTQLYKAELDRYSSRTTAARGFVDDNIDVTYYRLNLTVTTAPNRLSGIITTHATSVMTPLTHVMLNLENSMRVDSVRMGVTRVPFTQNISTLNITLDRAYSSAEDFSVEIHYGGVPSSTGFGSFEFSSHAGFPWVWSLSEPMGARDWWPCKDTPMDKADSADIIVTCATGFKVGSNGRLVSVTDNGNGTSTHHWAERYPISTYLISIALTNFAEYSDWFRYSPTDSMQILNFVLPEHLQSAQASTPVTVDALHILSRLFGQYPFLNEKYGHSEFGRGGAMEHQTMTSTVTFAEYVLVHELAHQWFGDMITCATWSDLWLNEGFAQYSEGLYAEQRYGVPSYREFMATQFDGAKSAAGSIHTLDTTAVGPLFNYARTYQKGAAVLHMLRHVVGDSAFYRILRSYASDTRFAYKTATTEGFRSVCESVSGLDLRYYFDEWIYGEGFPRYAFTWNTRPLGAGYEVTLQLRQENAASNFFTMPVDFRLNAGDWDTTIVVWNDNNNQVFTLSASRRPESVILDPDGWILHEHLDSSLPVDFALQQNFPNPFNAGTTISFSLPATGSLHNVSVKVYDILGREITTVAQGSYLPGRYTIRLRGEEFASGVYFYRLTSGKANITRKLILLR
jgi:aminopeptidase N